MYNFGAYRPKLHINTKATIHTVDRVAREQPK